MLPILPSDPTIAGLNALLRLEAMPSEVEGERRAPTARLAWQGSEPGPIRRRLTRSVRGGLIAAAVLVLTLSLGGLGPVAPVAAQEEPLAQTLPARTAPERGSNIIAVLIGL